MRVSTRLATTGCRLAVAIHRSRWGKYVKGSDPFTYWLVTGSEFPDDRHQRGSTTVAATREGRTPLETTACSPSRTRLASRQGTTPRPAETPRHRLPAPGPSPRQSGHSSVPGFPGSADEGFPRR